MAGGHDRSGVWVGVSFYAVLLQTSTCGRNWDWGLTEDERRGG